MSDLVRTMLLCGLISATEPFTVMALLLVSGGARGRRTGLAFIAGAFVVQSAILVFAALFLGDSVESDSTPGRGLLVIRMLIGLVLIVAGVRLRRPPTKEAPEMPKVFERLQGIGAGGAFLAAFVLADYQGPLVGSLALASSSADRAERILAWVVFSVVASGLPLVLLMFLTGSPRARQRIDDSTHWVMAHRRDIGSWFCLIVGAMLVGDAALTLALL